MGKAHNCTCIILYYSLQDACHSPIDKCALETESSVPAGRYQETDLHSKTADEIERIRQDDDIGVLTISLLPQEYRSLSTESVSQLLWII